MATLTDEDTGASASADFDAPTINADPCNFSLKLPSFSFGFVLPPFPFPPQLPIPVFGFELSCDPSKPMNMSAGLDFGGGRVAKFDVNPDDEDA